MHSKYGLKIFCYGINYTIARDIMFSSFFYTLSDKYNKKKSIWYDICFASFATIMTAPINYFRSRLYFDFNNPIKLNRMVSELKSEVCNTKINKFTFLFHNKFNIGLGTLRVGIGMAISKKIYELAENF